MKDETFGRLLKAGISSIVNSEGKTSPIIESELGHVIGVSEFSIQRYKAGHIPPEPRTIQILATAIVKRGYFNRDWLVKFLHAANYPNPDKLISQLFPLGFALSAPVRIYQNLPPPTYSNFIMREQAFNDVVDGLRQRTAVVLILSLGGMGKTSLAREIATRCLHEEGDLPKFDACVWVTDEGHKGTTNLNSVLDEIARTMDYPGLTQFSLEDKKYEVEQLLRTTRTLLVLDNFETITDASLLNWVLRLPDPSKTLLTTREYRRALRSAWPIELHGMSDSEADELLTQHLHKLKMESLVKNRSEFAPLIEATGRNPKAIQLALGVLKRGRQTLEQIVSDLVAANGIDGLFEDLFMHAWSILEKPARHLLMSMVFFPYSASEQALAHTGDISGFTLNNALEQLMDFSLLDLRRIDLKSSGRYTIHSLVRAFATRKLKENEVFATEARKRWLDWYSRLASQIGFCWNDIKRLEKLDVEDEQETLQTVIEWAFKNRYFSEAIQISKDTRYYYYVRGYWTKEPSNNIIRAEAARKLSNLDVELEALVYHINIASKQGNVEEVERWLPRINELARSISVSESDLIKLRHATALYFLAKGELDQARMLWEENLGGLYKLEPHDRNANLRWLATCLWRKGNCVDAQKLFLQAAAEADEQNFDRGVISSFIQLAAIDIDKDNLDGAEEKLSRIERKAFDVKDKMYIAQVLHGYGQLYARRHELDKARSKLTEAIDLFTRLGLHDELNRARNELAALKAIETEDEGDSPPNGQA